VPLLVVLGNSLVRCQDWRPLRTVHPPKTQTSIHHQHTRSSYTCPPPLPFFSPPAPDSKSLAARWAKSCATPCRGAAEATMRGCMGETADTSAAQDRSCYSAGKDYCATFRPPWPARSSPVIGASFSILQLRLFLSSNSPRHAGNPPPPARARVLRIYSSSLPSARPDPMLPALFKPHHPTKTHDCPSHAQEMILIATGDERVVQDCHATQQMCADES